MIKGTGELFKDYNLRMKLAWFAYSDEPNLSFFRFLSFAGAITATRALCCGLHHTYGNLDMQKTFSRALASSECTMYCRGANTSGTALNSPRLTSFNFVSGM